MEQPLYRYLATVLSIVDGDTIKIALDEGFRHNWTVNCRLAKIDADELNSKDPIEVINAKAAKAFLESVLPVGCVVYIISKVLDGFGRPIAEVYYDGVCINNLMLEKGFAVKYKK